MSILNLNNILENNEDLHEEFKTLLVKIEPHFVALKSNLEKLLCREWLHKLFKTGKHEESLRNAYLIKLFDQLVKGKLKEPFNDLPKHKSPLLPLTIRSVSKPNINVNDKKPIKNEEETLITDVVNVQKTADVPKSTENHVHTKEIKFLSNAYDKKTMKKVEETLITDEVNVHKTVDAPKLTENHIPTKEIKFLSNAYDKKTMKKVEETLITDEVNVHKTVDAPKLTENHIPTKEIKFLSNAYDKKTMKKVEETLITDEVNVHKTVDAPKFTENHIPTKEIKFLSNAYDKKTMKKVEETLITDEVNVHKTVDAPKFTENHIPTNEIKMFIDVHDDDTIKKVEETLITDMVNVDKTADAPKSTEHRVPTNEIKIVNASSNQAKQLDVNESADDLKEVQWQKSTVDESEGGDGLALNIETKLKLGSVVKMSNELKNENKLLAEQVQEMKLFTDTLLINHNQITTALNAELNKFQNDIVKMGVREAADELGASKLLENILEKTTVLDNKIVSIMNHLKTIVEDACASKKSNNFVMEQLKELHRLKMDEKEKFHAMLNKKLMVEISQLKEYVGKVEEEAMCKQLNDENYCEGDYSST